MPRALFLLFIALHLGIIFLYNAESSFTACQELNGGSMEAGPAGPALHWIHKLTRLKAVAAYAHYSGTAFGYGFFAPQVGSPFRLAISFYDPDGHLIKTLDEPVFYQQAGRMRYRSFLGAFQPLLPKKDGQNHADDIGPRLAKAFARSIAERQALLPGISKIGFRVLVYRFPSLREYPTKPAGRFILLYERFTAARERNLPSYE